MSTSLNTAVLDAMDEADVSDSIALASQTPEAGSLARVPRTVADTGLAPTLLEDLLSKTLLEIAVSDLESLVRRCALSAPVINELLERLKADGRLEIRAPAADTSGLRFVLTQTGRAYAREALERGGYVGPAPISAAHYRDMILAQSVRKHQVVRDEVRAAFQDTVIESRVLDQLGAAMHSGKGIFVYGAAGSGKTFICQRLSRLLGDPVLVPHAVAVDDQIVSVFDRAIHHPRPLDETSSSLMLDRRLDARFVLCERPFVTTGGELTADMLEIRFDPTSNRYQAPLQMKAANGIYLIDDLGRQRIEARELFNRWIVPMENGEDYLALQTGGRLTAPFDLILIFSTNLDPNDLADAAFLRRIGHKIRFNVLDRASYSAIWQGVCDDRGATCPDDVLDYVIDELHEPSKTPLLACHPRDLIGAALDFIDYGNAPRALDRESIRMAWDTNFVRPV